MPTWKLLLHGLMVVASSTSLHAQVGFVRVPASTLEQKDPVTGIPVTVRLSAFSVGAREVTQDEYTKVLGSNPSVHKGGDLPVENVSWWDAIRYCNLRSLAEKLEPCYDLTTGVCDRRKNGYRLLTDAEWSLAAGKPPEAGAVARVAHLGPADTKNTELLLKYARATAARPVGSLSANERGLYDMWGNVWEWVQDYQDPMRAITGSRDPSGPQVGLARVLRGGSYLTTTSRWGRDYRSSLEPERRSPYTGFRVCRTVPDDTQAALQDSWFEPYNKVPNAFADKTGDLSNLTSGGVTRERWSERRSELQTKWTEILGRMSASPPPPAARLISTRKEPTYTGELMYLQVEPDYWEKIYIMLPARADRSRPLPVVIVPFYDVDAPAGVNLGGRNSTPIGTRAYAHLAVQQGMAAVAIRWFGESYGENSSEVVANLKLRHSQVTGMGKWVWDSKRLLDYMATRPEFDMTRVGMIGHSLGGKMTLYATAMDNRIRAAVSSEPGIGLSFSNYEDFWYLGEETRRLPKGTDHHELLALIAPRPFLLIGGDSADNDKSWYYINSARAVYSLFGVPKNIGYLNHRSGHSPTPESIHLAMEWLRRFLREDE